MAVPTREAFGNQGTKPKPASRYVYITALLAVVALSLTMTFALPRPYYVWENDWENYYFFNACEVHNGLPAHNVQHPGTPAIELGRLFMSPQVIQFDKIQPFLNTLYLVECLAYCIAISIFFFVVLRRFSSAVAALALASLATWPAFLLNLNYFSSEPFILVFGLVALAVFWCLLESFPHPRLSQVVLIGALCGLCLALKLSFVPFVLSLECAVVLSLLRAEMRMWRRLAGIVALGISTCLAFALAIFPVLQRLDEIVIYTLERRDVKLPVGAGHAMVQGLHALLRESPFFPILLTIFVVLALVFGLRLTRASSTGRSRGSMVAKGFDGLAGLVFVVLLSCGFMYSVLCGTPGLRYSQSIGNAFRNASPAALVLPFAILYVARLRTSGSLLWAEKSSWGRRIVLAGAVLIVIVSAGLYFSVRQRMIHSRVAAVSSTVARLSALQKDYGRVAFWDKWRAGPISFDFWGNYRYASDYYDKELLNKFKGYTWLDLRDIQPYSFSGHDMGASAGPQSKPQAHHPERNHRSALRRVLHRVRIYWLAWKQKCPTFPERPHELYAGQNRGLSIGLIAFSEISAEHEVYRRLGWNQADLKSRLEAELGPLRLWKERVGGVEWIFMAPQNRSQATLTTDAIGKYNLLGVPRRPFSRRTANGN